MHILYLSFNVHTKPQVKATVFRFISNVSMLNGVPRDELRGKSLGEIYSSGISAILVNQERQNEATRQHVVFTDLYCAIHT